MTTMTEKRKALGRGLESLLPSGPRVVPAPPASRAETEKRDTAGEPTAVPAEAGVAILHGSVAEGSAEISGAQSSETATGDAGVTVVGTSAVVAELQAQAARRPSDGEVLQIDLELIDENPYQTRELIYKDELAELADSIRASGVLQPIVVRPGKGGRYILIVGDRRCKASKLAEKKRIPAVVRYVSEEQAAEMTIIENLQREDLNPIEQAYAFVRLSQDFGLTQEQIGDKVGLSRESVSNYMRLARLPEEVQGMLLRKELDFSMARLLLGLETPELISKAAAIAVKKRMTVEDVEGLVLDLRLPLPKQPQEGRSRWVDPNVRAAQRDLEQRLGMRVRIRDRRGKGKIVIEYSTLEDFDRVLEMLKGK